MGRILCVGALTMDTIFRLDRLPEGPGKFIPLDAVEVAEGMAAAQAALAAGFLHVFNVADGFEGPPDAQGHRGATAGWKADNLPWRQR